MDYKSLIWYLRRAPNSNIGMTPVQPLEGDKVVYANYNYNPDRLFSKPLHKGTIIGHVSHENYSDLTVQTEGGYIDKVCSYDAVKVD